MDAKKNKPRAYREITRSLLEMMQHIDYHDIAVADILRYSTYSKTSFYKYFKSKEDCFRSIIDDEIREYISFFVQAFQKLSIDKYTEDMYNMYYAFFNHILQKRTLYEQLLLNDSLKDFYSYFMINVLDRTKQHFILSNADRFSELYFYQHIHGTFGIVECWVVNGFDMTPEDMGKYCTSYGKLIAKDIAVISEE